MTNTKKNQQLIRDNLQDRSGADNINNEFDALLVSQYRFDIIHHLPLEIVTMIVLTIDTMTERFKLLDVSRTWRNKISKCSSVWSKIRIRHTNGFPYKDTISPRQISLLPLVKQHIVELEIMDTNSTPLHTIYRQIAQQIHFEKLQKLSILGSSLTNDAELLYNALSTMAMLKHLKLDQYPTMEHLQETIDIGMIITQCPILETFSFGRAGESSIAINEFQHHNNLISFELVSTRDITADEMKHILEGCTRLRRLVLRRVDDMAIDLLARLGTNLEYVGIGTSLDNGEIYDEDPSNNQYEGTRSSLTHRDDPQSSTLTATKVGGCGVRDVSLCIYYLNSATHYTSFFDKHSSSIRTLDLTILSDFDYESDPVNQNLEARWKSLVNVSQFTNLRALSVRCDSAICRTLIAPIIQSAPNLRWLRFYEEELTGQETITAIANLDHLQKLGINVSYAFEDELEDLFRTLSRKQVSTLEEVSFGSPLVSTKSYNIDDVLPFLADIPTLKHITFTELSDRSISKNSLVELFKNLYSCTNICSVTLIGLDCVDGDVLRHLAMIQSVEHVYLELLSKITPTDIQIIFENTQIQVSVREIHEF
ncbi:hypothetical protein BDA99DRAFT_499044 [Phascolomyces articulosus]|uniref:F-box domain-containing protein n=1 Tax=Phascolomyces articulosus TaxID=60185 RepID=A0AAD5K772_9FUNG|nr:hypothetical protein BDA99DRAFT_499044 [Phascolomyces articulosus]